MDGFFFQKYDIITVQTIAKKDIDLLKNQVINGSVQTWKVTWIYWKKFWIFYVLVSVWRERERERERGNYGVEKLRNYTRGNENKDGRWSKNFWTKLLCKQVIPLQWYIMLVRREKISKPHSKGSVAMLELFKFIPNKMA